MGSNNKRKRSSLKPSDLSIKNIDPKDKKEFPDAPFPTLPKHAFLMVIVAPPGSGKTNLLCYMVLNFYQKYFHRIIVCSTTVANDDKWWVVKQKKHLVSENKQLKKILEGKDGDKNSGKYKIVYETESKLEDHQNKEEKFDGKIDAEDMVVHLDELQPILQEQQSMIEYLADEKDMQKDAKYVADRLLVIIDDQAANFSVATNTPLNNFIARHRHFSASVIVVSQVYKALPKFIRHNAQQLILFEIGNKEELKEVYKERGDVYSEQEWLQMYKEAVSEPFSFMYFNVKFKRGQRFYKRFEECLEQGKKPSEQTDYNDDDDEKIKHHQ